MSTATEELHKTPEKKEEAEAQSNNFAEFLKYLASNEYETQIIALIQEIGSGTLGKETQSILEGESYRYKGKWFSDGLGAALVKGLKKKALTIKQINAFFEKILNAKLDVINFLETMALFKPIFKKFPISQSVNSQEEQDLLMYLTKTCFAKILEILHSGLVYNIQEVSRLFLTLGIHLEILRKAYQLQDEEDQQKLLIFLLNAADRSVMSQGDLILNLKIANPNRFEKYLDQLSVETRQRFNEQLNHLDSSVIELLKHSNYKEAAEIFSCHPAAPIQLLDDLNEDPNKISEKQIINFLNALLKFDYHKSINIAFLLVRLCLESPKLIQKNLNLPITLINAYLQYAFQSGQTAIAIALLSSKPSWNKYISTTVNALPEEARGLVLEGLTQEKRAFPEEFTVYEEYEIERFKKLLNSSIKEPEKLVKDAIERIGDLIYGTRDKHHKLARLLISMYLEQGIKSNRTNEVCNVLSVQPLMTIHILEAYQLLSEENQKTVLDVFLEIAGSKYNAALVGGLQDINPTLLNEALERLIEENLELHDRIQALLLVPKTERLVVSDIMEQFTFPFREMTEYAARLFCAETSKRKSYPFRPTVLHSSEFGDYLRHLKLAKPPIREKFILDSEHWIGGELEIPESGFPKIILMDSLGCNEPKTHKVIEQQCSGVFEKIEIYLSYNRRQESGLGCTVFTLRDIQDLYTVGKYLEPKYHGDMVGYATQNRRRFFLSQGVQIFSFDLPLRFARMDQDPSRLETLISWRTMQESSAIINKPKKGAIEGETALASAKKHFKKYTNKKGVQKEKNMFLIYKLNEMAKDVFNFLASYQFKVWEVEAEMEKFTLENFKKRISSKKATDVEAPKELYFRAVKLAEQPIAEQPFCEIKEAAESRVTTETSKTSEVTELGSSVEQAQRALINIFQLKIVTRIFSINPLIDDLVKMYENKEISNIETLKQRLKRGLREHKQKHFDDIDDKVYNDILDNLAILAKSDHIQGKKRSMSVYKK